MKNKNKKEDKGLYIFNEHINNRYYVPTFRAVGKIDSKNGWEYLEHIHTSFEIVYIIKGSLFFWCNDEKIKVSKGQIYFIRPNQRHKELTNGDVEFIYLRFKYANTNGKNYDFFPEEFEVSNQVINKDGDECREIVTLMEKILYESTNKELFYKEIVIANISELIWLISRKYKLLEKSNNCNSGEQNLIVNNAINFIENNINKKIKMDDITKHCNVSSGYLSRLFKDATGVSILKYADDIKMKRAADMLFNEDFTIKEVAYTFGYSDSLYFSKRFKKWYGISPSDYKNNKEIS